MKSLSLSIPKPCSEKWENFTHTTAGGFCSSCSKTVIDFTDKSDDEVFQFFKSKPAHTCGRFRSHQLRSYTTQVTVRPSFTLLKAGLLGLVLFLVSRPASAQTELNKPKTEIVDQKKSEALASAELRKHTVRGMVFEEGTTWLLPAVNVVLKGTRIGVATDSEGKFEFPQKLAEDDILIFSFIGFETKEITVKKLLKDNGEVKVEMLYTHLTGEVAVNEVYEARPTFWRRLKNIF
jgi:hypothetical protein